MRRGIWRFGLAALAAGSFQAVSAAPAGSPVDVHGTLAVQGNKIVDKTGKPVQLSGMSLFWSGWMGQFYNRKAISWIASDWKSTVVRAAIGVEGGGNYLDSANNGAAANFKRADSVIQAAIDNGIYVIIDWHDHYAHLHTAKSVEFFQRMAAKWGAYPNVIYEIFNEPMGYQARTSTKPAQAAIPWSKIEAYSDTVIGAIRSIDSTNLVLVGNPSWDQNPSVGIGSILNDKYKNLAYTLHFYAGTHGAELRAEGQSALEGGLAVFISEWGTSNADGGGAEDREVYTASSDEWLAWADQNNLSWCNWSLANKDESSAALLPVAGAKGWWADSVLSISGAYVRKKLRDKNGAYSYPPPPEPDKPDTASIPGRLQAEGFVAMSGIQSESGADFDGSDDIGYIEAGDWASYVVNVAKAGKYYFHARVASAGAGGKLVLKNTEGTTLASIAVAPTGGWQKWVTLVDSSSLVDLQTGLQRLTLSFEDTATKSLFNVNWVELKPEIELVGVKVPRASGAMAFSHGILDLTGMERGWSRVSVRDVKGQLLAGGPLREGAATLRVAGKGILFVELSGPEGREVRRFLAGD